MCHPPPQFLAVGSGEVPGAGGRCVLLNNDFSEVEYQVSPGSCSIPPFPHSRDPMLLPFQRGLLVYVSVDWIRD